MKMRIVGLCVAALFVRVASVRADTITVTSGILSHDSDIGPSGASLFLEAAPVNLHSLLVTMDPLPGTQFPLLQPGQTVAFDTRVTSFSQPFVFGDAAEGELLFVSTPITLPVVVSSRELSLQTPFTLTGMLRATSLSGAPVFNGTVVGAGSLSVLLREDGPSNDPTGRFFLDDATFTFAAPVGAATPEPATLLLLASGLLGVVRRRNVR